MWSPVRTTLAVLVCAALAACSDGGSGAAPQPTPTRLAVEPQQPHVTGRIHVTLRPGLTVMTDDRCTPEETRRVCSADGAQSWAPIAEPVPATLVEARTHLAAGHTSWTTVLRFAPGSRPALQRTARVAGGSGGVVLVMADDLVLAAAPAHTVHHDGGDADRPRQVHGLAAGDGVRRVLNRRPAPCDHSHRALNDPICAANPPEYPRRIPGIGHSYPHLGPTKVADNDAERSTATPRHTVDTLDGRRRLPTAEATTANAREGKPG